jgi:hypothetical protein
MEQEMIWGKTYDADRSRRRTPHLWFAWFPIFFLKDGRSAWLQKVWRVEVSSMDGGVWVYGDPDTLPGDLCEERR